MEIYWYFRGFFETGRLNNYSDDRPIQAIRLSINSLAFAVYDVIVWDCRFGIRFSTFLLWPPYFLSAGGSPRPFYTSQHNACITPERRYPKFRKILSTIFGLVKTPNNESPGSTPAELSRTSLISTLRETALIAREINRWAVSITRYTAKASQGIARVRI